MDFEITISPLAAESDIPSILEIERDSQPEPWTEKAFLEEIDRAISSLLVARTISRDSGLRLPSAAREVARLITEVPVPSPCHSGESRATRDGNPGVVAGYICFWSVEGEIQILNIAVRRTLRRRGVARKLIELAIRTGVEQHARLVTLEVRKSNLAARKLYEALGFRVTGERPNYYEFGVPKESGMQKESAILMELGI